MKVRQFIRQLQTIIEQQDGNDFEMPQFWNGDKGYVHINDDQCILKLCQDPFGFVCINVNARTQEYLKREQTEREIGGRNAKIAEESWNKRINFLKQQIEEKKALNEQGSKEENGKCLENIQTIMNQ